MIDLSEVEKIRKKSKLICDQKKIQAGIDKVAAEMNKKLVDKQPLLLCVMNGAVVFLGQLLPRLTFPLQIDYIHVSRYCGDLRGRDLHWLSEPSTPLEGRTVVIVDDVLDAGLTLSAVKDYCYQNKAKEILTAVLINKDSPREAGGLEKADFTGIYLGNKFLIGYGFDYQGFLRNLPDIYAVEE